MRKCRFSQEQIIGILKEREAGAKMADLCQAHHISAATFYVWRSRLAGERVHETQRLRQIEDENRRLKQLVADLSLDRETLRAVIRRRGVETFRISAMPPRHG
jgi:putative transposase